jgi:hypothetical protein
MKPPLSRRQSVPKWTQLRKPFRFPPLFHLRAMDVHINGSYDPQIDPGQHLQDQPLYGYFDNGSLTFFTGPLEGVTTIDIQEPFTGYFSNDWQGNHDLGSGFVLEGIFGDNRAGAQSLMPSSLRGQTIHQPYHSVEASPPSFEEFLKHYENDSAGLQRDGDLLNQRGGPHIGDLQDVPISMENTTGGWNMSYDGFNPLLPIEVDDHSSVETLGAEWPASESSAIVYSSGDESRFSTESVWDNKVQLAQKQFARDLNELSAKWSKRSQEQASLYR